jgi:hypothetical protein
MAYVRNSILERNKHEFDTVLPPECFHEKDQSVLPHFNSCSASSETASVQKIQNSPMKKQVLFLFQPSAAIVVADGRGIVWTSTHTPSTRNISMTHKKRAIRLTDRQINQNCKRDVFTPTDRAGARDGTIRQVRTNKLRRRIFSVTLSLFGIKMRFNDTAYSSLGSV